MQKIGPWGPKLIWHLVSLWLERGTTPMAPTATHDGLSMSVQGPTVDKRNEPQATYLYFTTANYLIGTLNFFRE